MMVFAIAFDPSCEIYPYLTAPNVNRAWFNVTLFPAKRPQNLFERRKGGDILGSLSYCHDDTELAGPLRLLRGSGDRQGGRAADHRDELAPPHVLLHRTRRVQQLQPSTLRPGSE